MEKPIFLLVIISLIFYSSVFAEPLSDAVVERRVRLEQELNQIEEEISKVQDLISKKQEEAVSLGRDIAIIDAQIEKTRLEVRSLEVIIKRLSAQIVEKESSIENILFILDKQKESLKATLKKLREYDDLSLIEIILSYEKISDYFGDLDSIDVIQNSLQEQFGELRSTKINEEKLKVGFVERKKNEINSKTLLNFEKRDLENKENERQYLLDITKGSEEAYKNIVKTKNRSAATIRSQLFLLQGSPAIPFEKAVLYTERASNRTDVRPAFILAIIAQESELGRNIGQCNLPDDPPKYKWRAIMKPSRDIQPYLNITSRLGLDPNLMPLSCPMSVGWGGAMGPAQFIPSTWVLFENRIEKATGHNPPNPWEPEDAFMASAIYLSDLGAYNVSREREAAGRYFAGSRWDGSLGRRYASQVLNKAKVYQNQINILKNIADGN